MNNIQHTKIIFTLALLLGISVAATAQTYNYVPDSTFDGNGLKSFIYFNNIDRAYGCALQADEKLVLAGLSKNPQTGSFELCVTRLKVNGQFDSTFHNNGTCFISMGQTQSVGGMTPKLKIAADGKIVVVNSGRSATGTSQDMMICRLDTSGFLDPTFNGTGVLFIDMLGTGTQPDMLNAFDFDAAGNIYAAGVTRTGATPLDNDFAVVKVNTLCVLDTTFDNDGKKLFNPTGTAEYGRGIKVQADGKIVVGGVAGSNMYLLRFDSTGTLDNTFNTTGTVSIVFQLASDVGAMDIDSLGRIIIAGQLVTSNSNIAIARYRSNGTFDPNFGFNGKYVFNVGGLANVITDMHIQSDLKILLGGYADNATTGTDYLITRVDTSGTIDITFNTLGFVAQAVIGGNVDDQGNGMAVMNDGRIMMTGTTVFSSAVNEDLGIMRVKPVLATGIHENPASQQIAVYPNPFENELRITSKVNCTATLLDLSGRVVERFELTAGFNLIETSILPAGIYFIQLSTGGGVKLIKN